MNETKEVNIRAIISEAEVQHLQGTDPAYVGLVRGWYDAIRAHVAALEGEINRLGHVSIEQEAELAAVRAEAEQYQVKWAVAHEDYKRIEAELESYKVTCRLQQEKFDRLRDASVELAREMQEELKAVKAERDELKAQMEYIEENDTEERNRYLELRRRIEAAPKVWGRYHSTDECFWRMLAQWHDSPRDWFIAGAKAVLEEARRMTWPDRCGACGDGEGERSLRLSDLEALFEEEDHDKD